VFKIVGITIEELQLSFTFSMQWRIIRSTVRVFFTLRKVFHDFKTRKNHNMRSSIIWEIKLQRRHHTLTKTPSTIVTMRDLVHISREFIFTFVAGENISEFLSFMN